MSHSRQQDNIPFQTLPMFLFCCSSINILILNVEKKKKEKTCLHSRPTADENMISTRGRK